MVEFYCKDYYRGLKPGDGVVHYRSYTEDEMNYYLQGFNDEYPPGFLANYLTLPKYAFTIVEEN